MIAKHTLPLSGKKSSAKSDAGPQFTRSGILPAQTIMQMCRSQQIRSADRILDDQIQPASLDLRLGTIAYRLRASFLPGKDSRVMPKISKLVFHEIDLTQGAVLETGCVYLIPLMEELALPDGVSGFANPKSSTGRIDVFTRLITDFGKGFDKVAQGYHGPLYLEVSPRTFPILVRAASRLAQIRFRYGDYTFRDQDLMQLHNEVGLTKGDAHIDNGLVLSIDLENTTPAHSGTQASAPARAAALGIIGYRAKRHAGLIDVDRSDALDISAYWEPLYCDVAKRESGSENHLILDPNEFYILASREAITIPPTHAGEMIPFDPLMGEFRVHYAGFFDPGFGAQAPPKKGSCAVLEVRSREVPFIVTHGQIIGRLIYEPLMACPQILYGEDIGSNYQNQTLRLSKHFKQG